MARVLVTGGNGFIGSHLVRRLTERGDSVVCLVRKASNFTLLDSCRPSFIEGDVCDLSSLRTAVRGIDTVFHLAGCTKSLGKTRLWQVNETGARNIAQACSEQPTPPILIHVSTIAAVGPSQKGRPLVETDDPAPVSEYGRSKRAGEIAVIKFCSRVPTTIIRPPIVLGEADRNGLALFKSIADWGIHVLPCFRDQEYSVIHADDLASALMLSAEQGRRLDVSNPAQGIYFAAANETVTYANLGRMVGTALGRRRIFVMRNAKTTILIVAAISQLVSRLRGQPHFLNFDKACEATAGSWACSTTAISDELGFETSVRLIDRIQQTAQWYQSTGWLGTNKKSPRPHVEEVHATRTAGPQL